jgi:hypothetical protein
MMMEMDPATAQWQEASEIVSNMLRQEATTYRRTDYIPALASRTAPGETIDGSWRQRIIEWMYGVIDHCNLRRESVAVATYFLDLSASRGLVHCRVDFQLIAMTSLMLSIKLNDSTMVKLDSMVKLGRGLFNEADVIAMEKKILQVFQWHVHPPTPVCFMRQLLRLMPLEASPIARYMIVEVTRFISEISSCLYKFVKYSASTMATAAVVVAMERVEESTLPTWQRNQFLYNVCFYTGLDSSSAEVCQAIDDLHVTLENNVNLQELMRTIDAQCNRGPCISAPKEMDTDEVSSPHSPREVHVHNFR